MQFYDQQIAKPNGQHMVIREEDEEDDFEHENRQQFSQLQTVKDRNMMLTENQMTFQDDIYNTSTHPLDKPGSSQGFSELSLTKQSSSQRRL